MEKAKNYLRKQIDDLYRVNVNGSVAYEIYELEEALKGLEKDLSEVEYWQDRATKAEDKKFELEDRIAELEGEIEDLVYELDEVKSERDEFSAELRMLNRGV